VDEAAERRWWRRRRLLRVEEDRAAVVGVHRRGFKTAGNRVLASLRFDLGTWALIVAVPCFYGGGARYGRADIGLSKRTSPIRLELIPSRVTDSALRATVFLSKYCSAFYFVV
jgi:hypothetical protein